MITISIAYNQNSDRCKSERQEERELQDVTEENAISQNVTFL